MIREKFLELIRPLNQAYKAAFAGATGAIVLRDLEQFCRGSETCFHSDPRIHAVLEGRREVWLRLQKQLQLSPEDLWSLRVGEMQTIESDDGRGK